MGEEDVYKMEDFSESIRGRKGAKACGVFWNVERYPFPVNTPPDVIYEKIVSYIREDFDGEISIWAYVDEKGSWGELLCTKTWKSRIYFLPGGDKRTRRNRMFHDVLLWRIDTPSEFPHPALLIVVSDEVRDDKMFFSNLNSMSVCFYCVFLVDPTENLPQPDSREWPALLFDQGFSFTKLREEASRKKHKAAAEGSQDQA